MFIPLYLYVFVNFSLFFFHRDQIMEATLRLDTSFPPSIQIPKAETESEVAQRRERQRSRSPRCRYSNQLHSRYVVEIPTPLPRRPKTPPPRYSTTLYSRTPCYSPPPPPPPRNPIRCCHGGLIPLVPPDETIDYPTYSPLPRAQTSDDDVQILHVRKISSSTTASVQQSKKRRFQVVRKSLSAQSMILDQMWNKIFTNATWEDMCYAQRGSCLKITRVDGPTERWAEVRYARQHASGKELLGAFAFRSSYLNMSNMFDKRLCEHNSMQVVIWLVCKITSILNSSDYVKMNGIEANTFEQRNLPAEQARSFLWNETQFQAELKKLLRAWRTKRIPGKLYQSRATGYLRSVGRYLFCLIEYFYYAEGICPHVQGLIGGDPNKPITIVCTSSGM